MLSPPMSIRSAPAAAICKRPVGGGPRIEIESAVGEAVGRHVDDAHHQRAPRQIERRACRAANGVARSGNRRGQRIDVCGRSSPASLPRILHQRHDLPGQAFERLLLGRGGRLAEFGDLIGRLAQLRRSAPESARFAALRDQISLAVDPTDLNHEVHLHVARLIVSDLRSMTRLVSFVIRPVRMLSASGELTTL